MVEFKQAGDGFSTDDIGKYFSALANEANLRGTERAWLVFGVHNKTRSVVGTDYRREPERLQSLKMQIAENTTPRITLCDIHELNHATGRAVVFEVPAAPRGMPIAWKGHYHARAGESLTSLGLDKQDEIRDQTLAQDWTAQVVPGATAADLDDAGLAQGARVVRAEACQPLCGRRGSRLAAGHLSGPGTRHAQRPGHAGGTVVAGHGRVGLAPVAAPGAADLEAGRPRARL